MSEARVALVTGGGRGIGRAISLALAEDGCDVAVNYRRDLEAAQQTVQDIEAFGRRAVAFEGTLDENDSLDKLAEAVIAEFGGVDVLVHNGGVASHGQSVVKTDPDELRRVMQVHTLGPHGLTQQILPAIRDHGRGDIVFISSVVTMSNGANGAPYNMAKAAMEALAFTLAKEQKRNNIHVNVVAPGLVDTVMGQKLVKGSAGIEDIRTLDAMSPFGRVCQPEDIANVVRFLCSEGAGYITGEKINVHGGGQ